MPADSDPSASAATPFSSAESAAGSALSPIVIEALYGVTGSFEVPLLLTAVIVVAGAVLRTPHQEGRADPSVERLPLGRGSRARQAGAAGTGGAIRVRS